MQAADIIRLLQLEPLPFEGGFFRQTYKSTPTTQERSIGTAIYYLITQENFSAWHRVKSDELFHFYAGDSVELWQIDAAGSLSSSSMGTALAKGERPQGLVPRDQWQALRLAEGGEWALLGTTVCPGFEYEDFELGERAALLESYPQHSLIVEQLTRA